MSLPQPVPDVGSASELLTLIPSAHPECEWLRLWQAEITFAVSIVAYYAFSIPLVVVIPVLCIVEYSLWRWLESRQRPLRRDRFTEPGHARVVCYGNAGELDAIRALTPDLRDPYLVSVNGAEQRAAEIGWSGLALLLAAPAITIYFGVSWPAPFFALWGAVVAVRWFPLLFRPTYLRITPGLLEFLRYRIGRSKSVVREIIDLRSSRVICRLDRGIVEILCREDAPRTITLRIDAFPDPAGFVCALVQAATCTVARPPLPDDELLG